MVTIDNICTRYHKLPSELLAEGTTFDLLVANTGILWERKQREDAEAEATGKAKTPKLTQQEMLDMIKQARGEV